MNGMQTTLVVGKATELEDFKKENLKPLKYLLEKYRQWKELKEKEGKGKGVSHAVSEPAAL